MNKIRKAVVGLTALFCLGTLSSSSCGGGGPKKESQTLNISVYLDLSDRLVRQMTPSQMYRDTAIVDYIVDYFRNKTLGPAILKSENKLKVFFYPTPNDSEIVTLAKGLSVDISTKKGIEKRIALDEMKKTFPKNLSKIYDETLKAQNWIGSDIWDFFSNKKVDELCVKDSARNIVVILTDGYIFDANNKVHKGNAYSYILPQTLANDSSSLIDRRKGALKGKGLEVLMLEINPYQASQRDKMVRVLEKWFASMGIEKFVVAETDANMTNTETIIENFLNH